MYIKKCIKKRERKKKIEKRARRRKEGRVKDRKKSKVPFQTNGMAAIPKRKDESENNRKTEKDESEKVQITDI